jgi:hypothetical protein
MSAPGGRETAWSRRENRDKRKGCFGSPFFVHFDRQPGILSSVTTFGAR